MAEIIIKKSYVLDNGDVSGMFSVPAAQVTEDLRIELVRLEGKPGIITAKPIEAPALITEPLTPGDIRVKIEGLQREISNLVVMLMDRTVASSHIEPDTEGSRLCPGREGRRYDDIQNQSIENHGTVCTACLFEAEDPCPGNQPPDALLVLHCDKFAPQIPD
jgi:hypothetical protein